jgi:hypothetical protein
MMVQIDNSYSSRILYNVMVQIDNLNVFFKKIKIYFFNFNFICLNISKINFKN